MKNNDALINMYENQIKDIDKQIQNIVGVIASGFCNETLQAKIESLELEKKKVIDIIAQEQKTIGYLPATKDELKRVYKKAQAQLLYGTFEEQKAVLHMFLNKAIIYKKYVEIYTNLIPLSHMGGTDINISPKDFGTDIGENSSETLDNTEDCTKKDGCAPSFLLTHLYSDNLIGSPQPCSPINRIDEPKFATFAGTKYKPRRPKSQEIVSRQERLWMFLTVKHEIEKAKLLNLKFVKLSSMEAK